MSAQNELTGRARAASAWAKQLAPRVARDYGLPVEPVEPQPLAPSREEGPTGRARVAAAFASQLAPKPAAVPQRSAAQSFSHLRLLNGVKGCAVPSGIVERIKSLLNQRTMDALAEARGLIEKLPEDHPQGLSLVREAYDVLIKLTSRERWAAQTPSAT